MKGKHLIYHQPIVIVFHLYSATAFLYIEALYISIQISLLRHYSSKALEVNSEIFWPNFRPDHPCFVCIMTSWKKAYRYKLVSIMLCNCSIALYYYVSLMICGCEIPIKNERMVSTCFFHLFPFNKSSYYLSVKLMLTSINSHINHIQSYNWMQITKWIVTSKY